MGLPGDLGSDAPDGSSLRMGYELTELWMQVWFIASHSRPAHGPAPSPKRKKIRFGCQRSRPAQQEAELMEWPNRISRFGKGLRPREEACGDKQ